VGKGYADGPALEERLSAVAASDNVPMRRAVYGCTDSNPERHFVGWLDEVDPDALFASGAAWGITVVERPAG
jgi:hypothetical protein